MHHIEFTLRRRSDALCSRTRRLQHGALLMQSFRPQLNSTVGSETHFICIRAPQRVHSRTQHMTHHAAEHRDCRHNASQVTTHNAAEHRDCWHNTSQVPTLCPNTILCWFKGIASLLKSAQRQSRLSQTSSSNLAKVSKLSHLQPPPTEVSKHSHMVRRLYCTRPK